MKVKNPTTNLLPEGISQDALDQAISISGYPLQQIVGLALDKAGFYVRHEWGFKDRNEGKIRNTDILASLRLYDREEIADLRVRPELDLIIECKKSNDPYIFFLNNKNIFHSNFPLLSGLKHSNIAIHTDDDPSTWIIDPIDLTGLGDHSFIAEDVRASLNFTKAGYRGGKKVEISGELPFNSLLLPLISAMQAYAKGEMPSKTALYFDLHLILGIAIVDAPMIGVTINPQGEHTSKPIPWVRVFHHEPDDTMDRFDQAKMIYGIDVVHKDFLDDYIHTHLLPFSSVWGERVLRKQEVLRSGSGFLPNLGKFLPRDYSKVKPYKIPDKAKRLSAIMKSFRKY